MTTRTTGSRKTPPPRDTAAHLRTYRDEKRARGECLYCDQRAADGKLTCHTHLQKSVAASTAHKQRRRHAGACISCVAPATHKGKCLFHYVYIMRLADLRYHGKPAPTPTLKVLQRYAAERIKKLQAKIDELTPFINQKDLWPTKSELRRIKT